MKRIAFLSADSLEGYTADDHLSGGPLQKLGWTVETVSWRKADIDWSQFAAVIIRSTWDYHRDLPAFLSVLERISGATRLANPLTVVRWNCDKGYLRELAALGARIVPTIWENARIETEGVLRWFEQLGTSEIVIKPTVSANAEDTTRLHKEKIPPRANLSSTFAGRSYMVQPFMRGILEEGEFSLFYFRGQYSHTIRKTPKRDDFRVQEEHGGMIRASQPEADLLRDAEKVIRLLRPMPLYARADFVRDGDRFALMELELIEPSLYLRTNESAPFRFADAIDRWLS